MILIVDNQSAFIKRFKRQYLSEQDFDYVFFDHNQPIVLSERAEIQGVILSGGKGNPFEPLSLTSNFVALINFDVPVLGLCLGHEILAAAYRGRIRRLPKQRNGTDTVRIIGRSDPIFDGLDSDTVSLRKQHSFFVSQLPEKFVSLAESDTCPNEIIRHRDKPVYGFQSHPEVSGAGGLLMVSNFLRMCGVL